MQSQKGFTLMELMIAVGLVAILAAIAMPSYVGYTQRAARSVVQADLVNAAAAMERRKAQDFTYGNATIGVGPNFTVQSVSPFDAPTGEQKYNLTRTFLKADGTAAASGDTITGFEILAVSTGRLATGKSEALKINHLGQRCYKALAASVTDCTIGTDPTWK